MAVKFSSLFDLQEEIGRGAFSIVKKAVNKKTKCVYAVKIFNTTKLSARDLQKLERESRICRKLSHSHIVQLFETMNEKNYHYMIFELITGGELFDDIVARECYSEQDASQIMQQIISGITYCHSMDIIHRDLKPENLLLSNKTSQASIKIADFGLAVESSGDELSWFGFAGTPGYLAPEVVKKVPYGKKIDVWACGVIMYILLVGYCPFWDDNNHKLYQQIKEFPVVFDGVEWESVSNEAKNLILLMLEKDPNSRLSAEKALEHTWITNRVAVAKSVHRQSTLATIRKFNARRKLKGAILSTMLSNSFIPKISGLRIISESSSPSSNESNIVQSDAILQSSVTSEIAVDLKAGESSKITLLQEDIIILTENFLSACECGDSGLYGEFCDNDLTSFLPNISGILIKGSSIQNFYFNNNKYNITKSSMISPNVVLLSNNSAFIAYVRLYQSLTSDGNIKILQFEETIIWQKIKDKWQVKHVHRSQNNNSAQNQNYII